MRTLHSLARAGVGQHQGLALLSPQVCCDGPAPIKGSQVLPCHPHSGCTASARKAGKAAQER